MTSNRSGGLEPPGRLPCRPPSPQRRDRTRRPFDGFGQLLLDNKDEALEFYRKTMAVVEGSRVAVVQAVRAVAESPVCDVNNLAYVFRYAIQKFRLIQQQKCWLMHQGASQSHPLRHPP